MLSIRKKIGTLLLFLFVATSIFSFTTQPAKAATQLVNPLASWTRYDDTNSYLSYTSNVSSLSLPNQAWDNEVKVIPVSGNVTFCFYGTGFSVLGINDPANQSSDISVAIDGTTVGNFSERISPWEDYVDSYSNTGLTLGDHTVVLSNVDQTDPYPNSFVLDAIDVSPGGYLQPASINPLASWTRYDDTNSYLSYTSNVSSLSLPNQAWDNEVKVIPVSGNVTFCFYGTGFSVLGINDPANQSSDISVAIDGTTVGNFSERISPWEDYVDSYSNTGLTLGDHTVVLSNVDQTDPYPNSFVLDAIDVSPGGYLQPIIPSSFNISVAVNQVTLYPAISYSIPSTATSASLYRDGKFLADLGLTSTQYDDTSLSSTGTHTYYVLASNSSGQTASNIISFVANAPTSITLSLSYDRADTKNITLTWSSSSDVTSYNVMKNNAVLANVPSSQTSYGYTMPNANDPTYQIGAINPYGTAYSNVISYNPNVPGPINLPFSFLNVSSWAKFFWYSAWSLIALFLGIWLVRRGFLRFIETALKLRRTKRGYADCAAKNYRPSDIVDVEATVAEYPVAKGYQNYKPSALPARTEVSSTPEYEPPQVQPGIDSIYEPPDVDGSYTPPDSAGGYDSGYKPGYKPKDSGWEDYKPGGGY